MPTVAATFRALEVGVGKKYRWRQDLHLRGQSPKDFKSFLLTAGHVSGTDYSRTPAEGSEACDQKTCMDKQVRGEVVWHDYALTMWLSSKGL